MKGMVEFGVFQTVENRSDLFSTVWKRGNRQGVVENLPLLVRFAAVARIVVCAQGASGRERARIGLRRRIRTCGVFRRRPDFVVQYEAVAGQG